MRRETESKLLRYKQKLLYCLPNTKEFSAQKQELARSVEELVNGMVLLEVADELPWSIYIEGKDVDHIGMTWIDFDFIN